MIRWLLRKVLCRFGRHDWRTAFRELSYGGGYWRKECVGCRQVDET